MGCGTSQSGGVSYTDQTSTVTLPEATAEEIALRKDIGALGSAQRAGLTDVIGQARSGDLLALSPQHQAQLDAAYAAARERLRLEGRDFADFLAGSRGLRMSDTPISQQALQRFGLGLSELESQRANAGLNLGLGVNQLRFNTLLNASQALPTGSVFSHNALFNTRLAQPTTRTTGYGSQTNYAQMSPIQQMLTGTQAFNQFNQGLSYGTQAAGNMGLRLFG